MRYSPADQRLFIKNRNKLAKKLSPGSVAIVDSNDEMPRNGDQFFPYRQNSDLFYLTGIDLPNTRLIICPDHPDQSKTAILFVSKPDEKTKTWFGPGLSDEKITAISGIDEVHDIESFERILKNFYSRFDNIYINSNEYPKFSSPINTSNHRLINRIKELYPLHNLRRLAPLLTGLRVVKEPEEIELMRKACEITTSGFFRVLSFLKTDVKEYEVEAEITAEFIRNGASGHAYAPIIASGKNACILHYNDNDSLCRSGDLLLMDFGAEYGNYAADMSRTIPVNGQFTKRQKKLYEAVLRIQKNAIRLFVPGNTINMVNKRVYEMLEEELVDLGLVSQNEIKQQDKNKPVRTKFLMHGIAHFIGLDVHDVGSLDLPFRKGMVLTCEPGLYLPDEGVGIRIENNIMVADKPQDLMADAPREVEEIEELMNSR